MCFIITVAAGASSARGQEVTDKARKHYESGASLFDAGDREQALLHFQLAHELSPRAETLFMIAQCEYHLGQLTDAREHYREFLGKQNTGDAADVARVRLEAIDRRPGALFIGTEPEGVTVNLHSGEATLTGETPSQFRPPRGRYRLKLSKPNHVTVTKEIDVDLDPKSLFFRLQPTPARLEIRTVPRHATLYVRGNRAQNPYAQQVEPGRYEIYAEATDYQARQDRIELGAGETKTIDFKLPYLQRSGHPELIGFGIAAGAFAGATGVVARLETVNSPASGTMVGAGALVGGIGGGLLFTSLTPNYIRDNLALFRIGGMWIGAVEGAATGLAVTQSSSIAAGWVGGGLGLIGGGLLSWKLEAAAPNYGRVAMIQSAAAAGAAAAVLATAALQPESTATKDYFQRYAPVGVLTGLNLGLAAGLALAYLPDQIQYGPTWRRVVLIDLAGAAGMVFGALASTVDSCLGPSAPADGAECQFKGDQQTAGYALIGEGLGLFAGWLLTRNYDRTYDTPSERSVAHFIPIPTALPVSDRKGGATLVPGLAAQGRF